MSFSAAAKNELCRLGVTKKCCQTAELSALFHMTLSIFISGGRYSLRADTESAAVARRAFVLVKNLFSIHARIEMRQNRLKKNHIYSLVIPDHDGALQILKGTSLTSPGDIFKDPGADASLVAKRCCRIAFLRGAFLGGGSISNPEKMYHMEFVSAAEEFAGDLCGILNAFGLNAKVTLRKNHSVVYVKEGDKISSFLSLIGAHASMLEFENIRVLKEMRNNVNRTVNCETANLSKTVNAAVRQIENILYLKDNLGFERLNPNLREVAELRINNPEASLDELKDQLSDPVGRSGVNHRLRRLNEIAENLKKEKGEL